MAFRDTPTPTAAVAAASPFKCFSFASTAASFCFTPHYRLFVVVLRYDMVELAVIRDDIPLLAVMNDVVVFVLYIYIHITR